MDQSFLDPALRDPQPEPGPELPNLAALVDGGGRGLSDDEWDEISNAGSDDLQLQADMAKRKRDVDTFLAQHRGESPSLPRGVGGGGGRAIGGRYRVGKRTNKSAKRGPRKAAEPPPEIKLQLGKAAEAYHRGDLDEALDLTQEIIRVNAETRRAWQLLAAIFQERGQEKEALNAMTFAAHLQHTEVGPWMAAADYALGLGSTEGERISMLETANLCYSAAIRADRNCIPARIGKGNVCLEQGLASAAASEYARVLSLQQEQRQKGVHVDVDLKIVRHLAEASFDAKNSDRATADANNAYCFVIGHARAGGTFVDDAVFEWTDVTIYSELFAYRQEWQEAITAIKTLSRWLLGRQDESFWDQYEDDDREWDLTDVRRQQVPEFDLNRYPSDLYGSILPVDLRAKLAIYRLKLRQQEEAMKHLVWLSPSSQDAVNEFASFPWLIKDVAQELFANENIRASLDYASFCRSVTGESDPEILVLQGKCYRRLEDDSAAEECFLNALEADDTNVTARYELAKMYESTQEKEEAFILINEAMSLEAQQLIRQEDLDLSRYVLDSKGNPLRIRPYHGPKPKSDREQPTQAKCREGGTVRARRRPRRLGPSRHEQRKQYEEQVTGRLKEKYRTCQELRSRVFAGDKETLATWMEAAQELVDDFRSFKEFYPWEKYLEYLGYSSLFDRPSGQQPAVDSNMAQVAQRLHQGLAPLDHETLNQGTAARLHEHRGIPLDDWLEIFVEYALALARENRAQDAYVVCQSARDSVVYRSKENTFLIHIAWAACAIYVGDEEMCVAVSRFFMREYAYQTDSYRMFNAICRICQSPVSWYTSGPAQKFLLRQIKTMDEYLLHPNKEIPEKNKDRYKHVKPEGLDLAILMTYGQILFASTSYTYAMHYFMRAHSIDPTNQMVNLSIALSFIHQALKRQADNRQYLLMQGFSFLFRYYRYRLAAADAVVAEQAQQQQPDKATDSESQGNGQTAAASQTGSSRKRRHTKHSAEKTRSAMRQEAHFNVARCYHLLALPNLAIDYYRKVLDEALSQINKNGSVTAGPDGEQGEPEEMSEEEGGSGADGPREDMVLETATNLRTYFLIMGDYKSAKQIVEEWLVIE